MRIPIIILAFLLLIPCQLRAQAIIADHNSVAEFDQIPIEYLTLAKSIFRIGYGHTSHGSQIITGIRTLRDNPAYGIDYTYYSANWSCPVDTFMCDNLMPGDLGGDWETYTRQALAEDTDGDNLFYRRNVIMWSWCGQVSYTTDYVTPYLAAMEDLRNDYQDDPRNIIFIYMTGHLDGTGVDGRLNTRNEQIRAHVRATGGVLFDFADIESYDPIGNPYLARLANDLTNYDYNNSGSTETFFPPTNDRSWALDYCSSYSCPTCSTSCAHSHCLNCFMKGKAFWWMMARLAGWPGVGNSDTTPPVRSSGQPSGTLSGGTTQATISLSTNENATCKYSTSSGVSYASMPNTFTTTGARSHSSLVTGLANGGTYHYYVRCQDASNNANTDDYGITFSIAMPDSTAPSAISNLEVSSCTSNSCALSWTSPGDDGSSGTATQYDLRYSTSSINASNFTSATQVSGEPAPLAAGTSQSMTVSGLAPSTTYYFAIRTRDEANNWSGISNVASRATQIAPDNTPPVISGGSPSGALPEDTVETTISVNTNENATCRYSRTAGVAYVSMTNAFSNTGGMNHSTLVTGLESGESYSFYVRCQDATGNSTTQDFEIGFSVLMDQDISPQINDHDGVSVTGGCGMVEASSKKTYVVLSLFLSVFALVFLIRRFK